ncbi:4-alpha-glucanotransferase [Turneriella parva]|uniref:4-alpha-glucanotransferase n=1 Tax=Turneriella parva (strain ATCC BAA-1111 / DSM 21527 / NCTC 11395 / H) TaxID=869212 RepID=I4B279_TURPD|nr:4-alpha-glucanotransferase [Turneriella parva]AFM11386.1 glycoside hydrolase family 77 [Turneriella parva DSM 21527]
MIFPVTGFAAAASAQKQVAPVVAFRTGRILVRDFEDSVHFREALKIEADDLYITKAAWLSEILHRVLLRTVFHASLQTETQAGVAEFLGIKSTEVDLNLAGLLWLSHANPVFNRLQVCFAGAEKIQELGFLIRTAAGKRLLQLLLDHSASIDAQLNALVLHLPGLLSAKERQLLRQIMRYDHSARFVSGGPAEPLYRHALPEGGTISRSADAPWMRELVLVAKIVSVWLADISRRFGHEVHRLDDIPEAEIARIAGLGVNGIWLVGLWQRSPASARIKTLTGGKNYGSAYSVFDYRVADEWGGDEALHRFRELCDRHGVRLGCDMVPNHTGIDSKWMRENPDWFMQTEVNPFPGYTFQGENLSGSAANEIRLEDHYYEKSDAAVVFALDRDGRRRYIYHGNDGTGLPWNDTAQLDHTNPAVRHAIIDTAVALSQNFSIIRFDAAMTLTRDHYRRLWFPHADEAPAIASRSVYSLPQHEFDARMPAEFWAELVTAFRARSPDTLLVAEAFWMTEMYFVRALGMHRVYNSAFMHALRDEKNAEFEANLRDFRQNDADTLCRFANYLSTPDEESAAVHFANTEKYFGAMTLMATLPGLPMLAPGQLEGYREKYGMDQQAPLTDELIDENFTCRYREQITPLMQNRRVFASPESLSFPACSKSGNVILYFAGAAARHLVVFNNSPRSESVRLGADDFLAVFSPGAEHLQWIDRITQRVTLAARSHISAEGLQLELAPYQTLVLADFRAAKPIEQKPAGLYPSFDRRYSGVAIPVSALRSQQSCGIGEFSDLKLLIDWCAETGQQMINLLPVNDTGLNSSPYSALSAMALHPVYIRLSALPLAAELQARVAEMRQRHEKSERVAFTEIVTFKGEILRTFFAQNRETLFAQVPEKFAQQRWLLEYAVFCSIKHYFDGAAWYQWSADTATPAELRTAIENPGAATFAAYRSAHPAEIEYYIWVQYLLHEQLSEAKRYADSRGVYLKGDMPIMLERDSVDVWLNGALFNHHLRAGAPPDMFSPEGQNWGFPVYNWPEHERTGYAWWRERIAQLAQYFAAYRIDHVLGFFRIWCIDENNQSGLGGFYLPSQPVTRQALADLGFDMVKLPALKSVRVHAHERREMNATLVECYGETFLNDTLLHEKGVHSLEVSEDLKNELLRRLHRRAFVQFGEDLYPAWDFAEKIAATPLLSDSEKHQLAAYVASLQAADAGRQEAQGKRILTALREVSEMLPCAEDLGVVPDYVRPALADIKILGLKVYRWEAENNQPKDPQGYPYLSLATSSVHDSSNLREWLASEPASVTGVEVHGGNATAEQVRQFLERLYRSPAMVVMVPLQDLLALDEKFHGPAAAERINVPGTVSDFNWTYRMPVGLEELLREGRFNLFVKDLALMRI